MDHSRLQEFHQDWSRKAVIVLQAQGWGQSCGAAFHQEEAEDQLILLQACGSSFQLPSSTWTSLWSKGLWREKCECVLVSLKVWNPFHLDVAWVCLHEHSMLPVTCLITSLEMKLPKVWNPMLPSCGIFLAKHMSTQCLHIAPSFYQMVFSVALNPKWM